MRRNKAGRIALHAFAWLVVAFMMVPILAIVPVAFSDSSYLGYPIPGFSLRWFEVALAPHPWLASLKNSFLIASLTTVIATTIGTLAAWAAMRSGRRVAVVLLTLTALPMLIPIIISALALYFFFSSLGLVGTLAGMVIAHTVLAVPYVAITVSASLARYDRKLTWASLSLGASPLSSFLRVTLPIIAPGILSGALFAFATSFDEIVVALFVSGPQYATLPKVLYAGLREQLNPAIVAVAVILLAVSVLLLSVSQFLQEPRRYRQIPKPATSP